MARPKVLLVDDYLDSLAVWAMYLEAEGFEVSTAPDGPAAMAVITSAPPDLIVMDLDLPGMTGIEIATALRAQPVNSHIPLIAVTGHTGTRLDAARAAGFDATLVKPCDPDALMREIRTLLVSPDRLS